MKNFSFFSFFLRRKKDRKVERKKEKLSTSQSPNLSHLSQMKDLILVGIQGSGKGTQAKILAQNKGYQIFETGGALRAIGKEDSDLGRQVKEITTRGDLVPNEIVMEIVRDFVNNKAEKSKPIIFDGIPRSEEQRQSLEVLLEDLGRDFEVLHVVLSEDEAFSRVMKRAEIEGRADDNPEAIRKRIQNFYKFTQPLLEPWNKMGKVTDIDGDQPIEKVTAEIAEKLG